jgi:murein DD-endopeptidase
MTAHDGASCEGEKFHFCVHIATVRYMPEMPTLGQPPKKSPVAAIAVVATAVGVLAGGVYWFTHRSDNTPTAGAPMVVPAPVVIPEPVALVADAGGLAMAAMAVEPAAAPRPEGIQTFSVTINGPLEGAIVGAVGKEVGAPLTQVVNRSLVWWLKVPNDVLRNDTLTVAYETRAGQEPLVHAVRYQSRKFTKTFEAFRFRAPSATFARAYQPDGTELEERLVGGPLDAYEQITSLLRDGRKHKGVDFKTPVGTPVKATFNGVITRKNWHFRGNGNSLEIDETGGQGRTALFLHLQEVPKNLKVGDVVKKGQVLAPSGNTGRSFAPHLHYQLMKGSRVIDPFESHQVSRASIDAADRPALDAEVARLRSLLPAEQLAGN